MNMERMNKMSIVRIICLVKGLVFLSSATILSGCAKHDEAKEPKSKHTNVIWPKLAIEVKQEQEVEVKVKSILSSMTLEQKVAQMIQPEIRDITVEDMRKYGFGSYLNGGGAFPANNKHSTPADWIDLAEKMYQASIDDSMDGSSIPTMWGTDAVHGHNNVIGATLFPHNIGLGATNNPRLIERIARATATEVMATGIDWVFAPTVATVRDDRWGRTYEGYSEDPEIVKAYSKAIVYGLQGKVGNGFLGNDKVISTVKHFLGDGGTINGDDQGNNTVDEQALFKIHAQGYVGGLSAGAQTVMASFNSWQGDKVHGNKYLLTDVLKHRMGFDGLVVGDWNGHGQVKGCSNESCPQAINAGLDVFMAPTSSWKPLFYNTIEQVKKNIIPITRIDDAVSRILRVKIRAGLFEKPSPANRKLAGRVELIGAETHREIARQAVRESLVLLKNQKQLLPLVPNQSVLVTGDGANNIGKQSGGWTITWQGTGNGNDEFPGGSTIYQGIAEQVESAGGKVELSDDGSYKVKPDVAIVVFGEEPYAEGHGDIDNLEYQRGNKKDLALLKNLKAQNIPVVSLFISGRPMWVNPELNHSDAFVAVWLPGSEGKAVAEVLFKDKDGNVQHDFKGQLSFSWPAKPSQATVNRFDDDYSPLLPYGFGLRYGEKNILASVLSEDNENGADNPTELVLFERSVKAPWRSFVADRNGSQEINSSVAKNNAVSFRTRDRHVQEDIIAINFNGKGEGRFGFRELFPNDLRGLFESDALLKLSLRVEKLPTDKVMLAMLCESGCASRLDITDQVKSLPLNNWSELAIPVNCFEQSDFDKSKVTAPLVIGTKGEFSLSLFDARIEVIDKNPGSLSCE